MKNNFRLLVVALGVIAATPALAQKDNVGIGTTKPDQSAALDVSSSNKGLLMPRMTLQQRNAIQNPAQGLMVYQSDMLTGFYFFDGKEWKPVTDIKQNSVAADPNDWTLAGNDGGPGSGTLATATSRIGTPSNIPLNFQIGGVRAGLIDPVNTSYSTFYGFLAGASNTQSGGDVGNSNTAIGATALYANTVGDRNTAIGLGALNQNTGGVENMALGGYALYSNNALGGVQSSFNMGVGTYSLFSNTTGSGNTAVGTRALFHNTTGETSTAIGYQAGYNKNGTSNVYIGYSAGYAASLTNENSMLVINNKQVNPLISGSFGTNTAGDGGYLKFHLGTTAPNNTTGFLAIGDFSSSTPPVLNFGGGAGTNSYRLIVQDGIMTEKIKVAVKGSADWADYVFEPSYKLMTLDNVEAFVKENYHLPNVPSASEMSNNGLDVMQTSAKLLEKIEELTLYMIQMNKEIKVLKAENAKLKK